MGSLLLPAIVIVLIAAVFFMKRGTGTQLSPQELLTQLDQADKPFILDSRSQQEYAAGHVPGAVLIPFQEVKSETDKLPEDKAKRIVIYCESGMRAAIATRKLKAMGFTNIYHLAGDMAGWRAAGHPTAK